MTREDMLAAVEICMKHRGTVEFKPVVGTQVKDDYIGLVYACPALISELVKAGYSLSLSDGHILIDKY